MSIQQFMRSHLLIILCSLIVLLSACSTPTSESNSDEGVVSDSVDVEQEDEAIDDEAEAEIKDIAYEVTQNWFVTPIEDANEQVVLLTIDDAPDEHGVEMAETLKELDAPAIFFVNGHFLQDEDGRAALQQIDDLGFPIGNHTMTHSDLMTLSEEEQKEEIVNVNTLVEEIIGKKPEFFRAPFGKNTDYSTQLVEAEGMLLMNWTYGYDWEKEYQESVALTDIMVNTPLLDDGAILLMHDRDWTNDALSDIVTGLQEKGYDMLDPLQIETINNEG